MPEFKKIDLKKFPLKHGIIVETIIGLVIKTILRYILMGGYLLACKELGLYNHGWITKIIVTITSICLSRYILREIGRMVASQLDEPFFEDIGIVSCIRGVIRLIRRW